MNESCIFCTKPLKTEIIEDRTSHGGHYSYERLIEGVCLSKRTTLITFGEVYCCDDCRNRVAGF